MTEKNYSNRIIQQDARLNSHINKSGCNFLSLLGLCQTHTDTILNPVQISNVYIACLKRYACMLDDCSMLANLHYIFNAFSDVTGIYVCGYQIGSVINKKYYWWGGKEVKFTGSILVYSTASGEHYTEGDDKLKEVWDPFPFKDYRRLKKQLLYFLQDEPHQVTKKSIKNVI